MAHLHLILKWSAKEHGKNAAVFKTVDFPTSTGTGRRRMMAAQPISFPLALLDDYKLLSGCFLFSSEFFVLE